MIVNNAEAFEMLGATVSVNIARHITGDELPPIVFTDIAMAITALDPNFTPEEQGRLYGYQQAGRRLAGLVTEADLVDDQRIPEWQREICDTAIIDIGNFALASATGQVEKLGNKSDVPQNTESWIANGIKVALDDVIDTSREMIKSRTLAVMRNSPANADQTVPMLFVATCAPGTPKLDTVFGQVYGDSLSDRLVSKGLLEHAGMNTGGRLKITDQGVSILRERLADFKRTPV